jgi:hypothetical protein
MPFAKGRNQAMIRPSVAMSAPSGNGNQPPPAREEAEPRSPEAEGGECCALLRPTPVATQAPPPASSTCAGDRGA